MTKTPIITLSSNGTNIAIKQDSVNVAPVYNVSVAKANYSDTLRLMTIEELKTLSQAIELYLTIID